MALSDVTSPEAVRLWRAAGLRYVLLPAPDAPGGCETDCVDSDVSRETISTQSLDASPEVLFQGAPPRSAALFTANATAPDIASPGPDLPPHPQETEAVGASSQPPTTPNDVDFPPPWDIYLGKLAPASVAVFTYWELGRDMASRAPDAARRALLQKLIHQLRLPKGTLTFWPPAAHVDESLHFDLPRFLAGLERAGSPHVVCFGPELFGRLFPGEVYAPAPRDAYGRRFHFMPQLRPSLLDDSAAVAALVERLRAALPL